MEPFSNENNEFRRERVPWDIWVIILFEFNELVALLQ